MDCNTIYGFEHEYKRCCDENIDCVTCVLYAKDSNKTSCLADFILESKQMADKVVSILQKWSDENPMMTRFTKLKGNYPNSIWTKDRLPCPKGYDTDYNVCCEITCCCECEEEYWLTPVEEEKDND